MYFSFFLWFILLFNKYNNVLFRELSIVLWLQDNVCMLMEYRLSAKNVENNFVGMTIFITFAIGLSVALQRNICGLQTWKYKLTEKTN